MYDGGTAMAEVRLTLIGNGLDFFSEGIQLLDQNDPRKLKYAILHVASAAELVLKARLAQEHWTLIFRNPSKATVEEFERRKFTSVDFDGTLERLKNVCRIDLSRHRPTLQALRGYPHTDAKERSIDPVLKECPVCGVETMIEFESGGVYPADPAWICFSCGESGSPTSECRSCGEEFPWEMDVYLCAGCRGEAEAA
jgi:hypothetical protein